VKTGALALPATRTRAADFLALAKPRLNVLVVLTAAVGYYLGAPAALDVVVLFNTIVGTALVAGGAAALNQLYERDIDGLMERTRFRPLPDGRIQPGEAASFAGIMLVLGLVWLAVGTNVVAAGVAFATVVFYAAIYTPMKRRTPFATIVGAIPGALPPVIGWAAAQGRLGAGAWVLFAIVFLWQVPHFLAIAWLYRDDYARARLPLLPVIEPDGRSTARQVLLYGSALVPVSLAPTMAGLTGPLYGPCAAILTLAFFAAAIRFARHRTLATARWLFFGSIVYLPLLWVLLIATRIPAARG
jgi:protoheme IX farnesyltransferase